MVTFAELLIICRPLADWSLSRQAAKSAKEPQRIFLFLMNPLAESLVAWRENKQCSREDISLAKPPSPQRVRKEYSVLDESLGGILAPLAALRENKQCSRGRYFSLLAAKSAKGSQRIFCS